MQEYAKKYCSMDVIYFLKSICKKKRHLTLYPETVPRNRQCFEESLLGGKVVENLTNILNK